MAVRETLIIDAKTEEAAKNIDKLKGSVEGVKAETDKSTGSIDGMAKVADSATGGMISKFQALTGTLRGVTGGFKTMGMAIAATGIGLLVLTIAAITAAFRTSEEGQNKWAKAMAVVGAVVGKFTDVLSNLGFVLIDVFTKPIESVKKLGNSIVNFFKHPLDTIKALVSETKEFIKETEKAAKTASKLADQTAKADRIERELIVKRAKADKERADLLEKAQQRDKFSQQERIQFLRDASAIEEKITNQEIQAAEIRKQVIIESNELAKSGKKDKTAEAEATAKVIQLETARLTKQKEVTSQIQGLIEQEKATTRAASQEKTRIRQEEAAKRLEIEKAAAAEAAKIEQDRIQNILSLERDFFSRLEDAENEFFMSQLSKQDREIIAVQDKYFALIEEAKQFGVDTATLEEAQQQQLAEIREKYRMEEFAKNDEAREKEAAASRELQEQKRQAVQNGLSAIADLTVLFEGQSSRAAERAFKVQKAANIAQTLIDTYASATSAYKSLVGVPVVGPVLGAAAAAASVAAGLANVKRIKSQQFSGGSVGGASASVGGSSSGRGIPSVASQGQTPQFNVVGNSGQNQLQGLDKPIKAFVVSTDVSNAQSLERNKIATATL